MAAIRAKVFSRIYSIVGRDAVSFTTFNRCLQSSASSQQSKKTINVTLIKPGGLKVSVPAQVGDSLLDVVVNNKVEFDCFGACEGTMSCSTCHVILKEGDYKKVTTVIADEETDMLDLAFGVTSTSRLGCQVFLKDDMDGFEVTVPSGAKDQRDSN